MTDSIPMPPVEAIELDVKTGKPFPYAQDVTAETALKMLHEGVCDSIHWQSTEEQIARNERMHPGNRALYVKTTYFGSETAVTTSLAPNPHYAK